jgi:hypothetical protein
MIQRVAEARKVRRAAWCARAGERVAGALAASARRRVIT